MTLEEIGATLRKIGANLEIKYGSGGYGVLLKGYKTQSFGCKWDIEEAFQDALNNFRSKNEETTKPGKNS